ncbi:MAG: hypothetical protein ACP5JJ_13595 [Anaerolineae bacterium]
MPAATELSDSMVFWLIAGARFLLPLVIPRYPLPGILASLLLDGIDQTLFQQFTNLSLASYQGYDKAFDIYYLSMAYISTKRNWRHRFAFSLGRLLFFWRLVGVALFELTDLRALLLAFPNTFEYFFIFYEACRLRYEPQRIRKPVLLGAAAAIWLAIKLPQEYWIHIAQADTTDWLKTSIFRMPLQTPWTEVLAAKPGIFFAAVMGLVLIAAAAWWLLSRYLPAADRAPALSADAYQPPFTAEQVRYAMESEARSIVDATLLEKATLVGLVGLSFAQVLPGVQAGNLEMAIGLTALVTVNTALTHWRARRGFGWSLTLRRFLVMLTVNGSLVFLYSAARARFAGPITTAAALFLVLMLTLLVTMFDHYRQLQWMHFSPPP